MHPVVDMDAVCRDESVEGVTACRQRRNDAKRPDMGTLPNLDYGTFAFSAFGGREGERAPA